MDFEDIVEAIQLGRVLPSRHSRKEAADDDLVLGEIYESVLEGELIEEYPDSYLMPAGLILGFNTVGDPIHSVWGYDQVSQTARLITVYRPSPDRWINWRQRRWKS
jgi:Domain of unknown function (DUF4258)